MPYLPFNHWRKPLDRPIKARLPDGTELMVEFNPLTQDWRDTAGERIPYPVEWWSEED